MCLKTINCHPLTQSPIVPNGQCKALRPSVRLRKVKRGKEKEEEERERNWHWARLSSL